MIEAELSRLKGVLEKIARGLYYYELGEPALEMVADVSWNGPAALTPYQLKIPGLNVVERETSALFMSEPGLQVAGLPEVGSRMLTRLFLGSDQRSSNYWQEVQTKRFKYLLIYEPDLIVVKMVIRDILSARVMFEAEP